MTVGVRLAVLGLVLVQTTSLPHQNVSFYTDGMSPESMQHNFLSAPVPTESEAREHWPLFLNASCELFFNSPVSESKVKPQMALFLANNSFELTYPHVVLNADRSVSNVQVSISNLPVLGYLAYDEYQGRKWDFMWVGGFTLSAVDWNQVDPLTGAKAGLNCWGWSVCGRGSNVTCATTQAAPMTGIQSRLHVRAGPVNTWRTEHA
eukprot:TRINITY_DN21071_c0_g1_i4.p2 TRINITY_DN21071_c0_g1~~TRINITY_DN21071_c0_g1_i4.p2  ORF type:complete len:206 (-),score=39.71 TRINITY_DN21071_c0_g1_i4:125-742(-)